MKNIILYLFRFLDFCVYVCVCVYVCSLVCVGVCMCVCIGVCKSMYTGSIGQRSPPSPSPPPKTPVHDYIMLAYAEISP